MCGIIGYTGTGDCAEKLLAGLSRLEYRGYDSAGISWFESTGEIKTVKTSGRLSALREKLGDKLPRASAGIGHTRWATHGAPTVLNAHPHSTEAVSLVHNGIIENYSSLRDYLTERGYSFVSDTDTEAAVKLIDMYYKAEKDPLAALTSAVAHLKGSFALGVIFRDREGEIYAVRVGSPLVVAFGEDGNYIASDIPAFLDFTDRYFRLEEGEIACVCPRGVRVTDRDGREKSKKILTAEFSLSAAEKGGYPHFMLKEICEEPRIIGDTAGSLSGISPEEILPGDILDGIVKGKGSIRVVACGTAMHAGLIGKYFTEKLARIPVEVSYASEFRYSEPIMKDGDLVILISQSGETADTLAALRMAKERGIFTLAVVNAVGSAISREADRTLLTLAGPEIAVASTKAYSAQLTVMYILAAKLAAAAGRISREEEKAICGGLTEGVPGEVDKITARAEEIKALAGKVAAANDVFFIGRGIDYCLATEASLKLKEISYIHSEAYPAGELKHGTISLITEGTPVIALVTDKSLSDKTVSNIKEVAARGGEIVVIAAEDVTLPKEIAHGAFIIPGGIYSSFYAAAVLQLLAYHAAVLRGCDVDRPRNLAKSVTVE
ncbi:MAG: glutamine--fructose-6-phosphate transaminase (isomerizing) [Clostridia bacterium]|nr:glutamine--fructose-6-phosphate transaminase (isomerizing) [Clostridia bacterium]